MREYENNGYLITEYPNGAIVKQLISNTEPTPDEPQPTIEEQILAENQYQTALLELSMMGGI